MPPPSTPPKTLRDLMKSYQSELSEAEKLLADLSTELASAVKTIVAIRRKTPNPPPAT